MRSLTGDDIAIYNGEFGLVALLILTGTL